MRSNRQLGYSIIGISLFLIIILVFVKISADRQGEFLCEAVEQNPALTMEECPAHKSNLSWLIFFAFGIAFLILAIGIYIVALGRSVKEEQFKEIDLSKLDDEEKKIYGILKENEGSMYQSDLMKATELTKVQTTRILDKMESKKILERKRRGMTNIVVLR